MLGISYSFSGMVLPQVGTFNRYVRAESHSTPLPVFLLLPAGIAAPGCRPRAVTRLFFIMFFLLIYRNTTSYHPCDISWDHGRQKRQTLTCVLRDMGEGLGL